jgi:hypothetical protein
MAKMINASAGRGIDFGVDKWGNAAKHVMLAPRFMISRFEAPRRAIGIALSKESSMGDRLFIAKQWGAFMSTGFILLGLASMLDDVEIGTDPEDSDFLKIVWGNKRIDIWGGFLQPAQLFARLTMMAARSQRIVDSKPPNYGKTAKDEIARFIQNRTSPIVNILGDMATGKNFGREEIPPLSEVFTDLDAAGDFRERFLQPMVTPLLLQETAEAYELDGVGSAAWSFGMNFMGFGTNTYKK